MAKLGTFMHIPTESWLFQDYGDVRQARENALRHQQLHGASTGGERNIEEFVRQWAIRRLIDGYGYPAEWLNSRLTIELLVTFGSRYGQADIALLHPDGYPFAIVEIKPLNTSEHEFRKARLQLESYLSATHTATIGMLTDGNRMVVICKQFDPPAFIPVDDLPTYEEALSRQLTSPGSATWLSESESEDATNDTGVEATGEESELAEGEYLIPTVEEYVEAFQLLEPQITEQQRAMLRAHYQASRRTVTATELANLVGASSFRVANSQYGRLAGNLIDVMNWPYQGRYVNLIILVSFTSPSRSSQKQWLWTMLPEVVEALERLDWV
jgi:hypothetical protein